MRYLLSFLLIIHGMIHSLGFIKGSGLEKHSETAKRLVVGFSQDISRISGTFWFLSSILFLFTFIILLIKKDWWWIPCIVGVVLSQSLIIIYWQYAKYGSVINMILLLAIIVSYANWNFKRMISKEKESFLLNIKTSDTIITENIFSNVPTVIQRWLKKSNVIGQKKYYSANLSQSGQMKTTPDGKWMEVKAEQLFRYDVPGFIWVAEVSGGPFMKLSARDKYEGGKGNMLVNLFTAIPIANSKGTEIDQGTLLRFMAEVVWNPSAALESYIRWEQLDLFSAIATMEYAGVKASGIFRFNEEGDVMSFEANRYYNQKSGATLEKWFISIDPKSFKEFNHIRIPTKASVIWKLDSGDFTWYRLEITNLFYSI